MDASGVPIAMRAMQARRTISKVHTVRDATAKARLDMFFLCRKNGKAEADRQSRNRREAQQRRSVVGLVATARPANALADRALLGSSTPAEMFGLGSRRGGAGAAQTHAARRCGKGARP